MKRSWLVGVLAALVAGLFLIPNLWAVDAPKGDIMLKAPAGVKAKKAPVKFSHAEHAAFDCTKCHHEWDGKAAIKKCTDAGCHDIFKAKGKDKKSIKYYYNAYHDMCMKGCHKDLKKAGKETGPTACNGCHPKK